MKGHQVENKLPNHKITLEDVLQMHQISLEIQNKGYKHATHHVGQ